jgi:divalent metal cation (Fe/Co/Zn/Cd) transporter
VKKDVLREEQRLAHLLIIWRIPSCIASLVAASVSGLMVVWLEFLENASVLIPAILLATLSKRMGYDLRYQFNYGTGKLEALTAFACEMFDIAGLFCILTFSVRSLTHAEAEERQLLLALGASIAGSAFDFFLLSRQKKLTEREHSKMLHTAYLSARKDFAFDCIAVAAIVTDIVFSGTAWIRYFSPVLCIAVAIPFGVIVLRHLRESLVELTDHTLDEDSQLKLLKVLVEFRNSYDDWRDLRSRTSGKHKYIDIEIGFRPETPYGEAYRTVTRIRERISEEIEDAQVNFLFCEWDRDTPEAAPPADEPRNEATSDAAGKA